MNDTDKEHAIFHTDAPTPNGKTERVTHFSYVKFKIRLYTIASPIVGDMHFHRAPDTSTLRRRVQQIDHELSTWFDNLPPELLLDRLSESSEPSPTTPIFTKQALALQIAYDNILILLHRPLLPHAPLSQPATSQSRLWESAIRSSLLTTSYLDSARQTHAAAFLGINLFTAGMVLCIFALSDPLSERARQAKYAVARMLALSKRLEGRAMLAGQTTKVLGALVRVILEREMEAILGGEGAREEGMLGADADPSGSSGLGSAVDGRLGPADRRDVMGSSAVVGGAAGQVDGIGLSVLSGFDLQQGLQSLQQGT